MYASMYVDFNVFINANTRVSLRICMHVLVTRICMYVLVTRICIYVLVTYGFVHASCMYVFVVVHVCIFVRLSMECIFPDQTKSSCVYVCVMYACMHDSMYVWFCKCVCTGMYIHTWLHIAFLDDQKCMCCAKVNMQ